MNCAVSEATSISGGDVFPEHILLGVLEFAGLSADDFAIFRDKMEEAEADFKRVNEMLSKLKIQPSVAADKLRRILRSAPPSGDSYNLIRKLYKLAGIISRMSDRDHTLACDLLSAMVTVPSPVIRAVLRLPLEEEGEKKGKAPLAKLRFPLEEEGEKKGKAPRSKPTEDGKSMVFLAALTRRVRDTRNALLEKVFGQDQAVHAFVEGMFSAEVLAQADEDRLRPRAIFVFVGPPGVGKTFLAEQAAAALGVPFKRFDMSGYSDHQAHIQLIGFPASFKDSKPGTLTGFVKGNPRSVLLFDEIEKASNNSLQLFLQVLDAGRLHDDYLDKDVSFKDTIIVFTTNAGRSLYEGSRVHGLGGLARQTILEALEKDSRPDTGQPYFPAAILSRLATGYLIVFNHLDARDLVNVCSRELARCGTLLEKQYGLAAEFGELLPATLLFAEGGQADARTIRARSELFFKNELFKLCQLWGDNIETSLAKLKKISFAVDTVGLPEPVGDLFYSPNKIRLLVFGDVMFAARLQESAPDMTVLAALDQEDAFALLGKNDVGFTLLKLFGDKMGSFDPKATRLFLEGSRRGDETMVAFDNVPMAAKSLNESRAFFKELRERMPELPVYLLETDGATIDAELVNAFTIAGARGKLVASSQNLPAFIEEMAQVAGRLHLQNAAATLAAERKTLAFETAPMPLPDKSGVTIRLRELDIKRAPNAADSDVILGAAQKPTTRFDDVIGAGSAKEELGFFVQYLKDPKDFAARGLKPPKGVLLYGPPGTGKTLLAKAMAGESDVAFIPAAASSFVTKWQGSGPESIRELFERARRYAPSVVFIDEIDAIGRARGGLISGHAEEMALNALLTEMDGFSVDSKRPVFVLAATNFAVEEGGGGMGHIDPALVRRFDRKILVDLPAKEDRHRYLEYALGKRPNHDVSGKMVERLAERSGGLSLANLESVIELAFRNSLKRNITLNDETFEEAFEVSLHGEEKNWGREYLERVARHESGHAFLCHLNGQTPSYLTIVSRGKHGGYMEHAHDENSPLLTKEALLARVRVSLGGRAAEIVYYGNEDGISTGAAGDFDSATRLVKAMISKYGMDDGFGLAFLSPEEADNGPAANDLRREVNEILRRQMELAIDLIRGGKDKIDKLVEALLEKNKLTTEEMEAILGA
ncbi:MAG: AAA family ATPase [Deltaproteobacteria bacterium]|nr:AAA family ATPase [Deltaproteobacteria bacterium]